MRARQHTPVQFIHQAACCRLERTLVGCADRSNKNEEGESLMSLACKVWPCDAAAIFRPRAVQVYKECFNRVCVNPSNHARIWKCILSNASAACAAAELWIPWPSASARVIHVKCRKAAFWDGRHAARLATACLLIRYRYTKKCTRQHRLEYFVRMLNPQ